MMERFNMRLKTTAITLLVSAGVALAQEGRFDRPMGEGAGGGALWRMQLEQQPQASTFVSMARIEGDQRYEVEIRDDVVTARINGREVPADRIRRTDSAIELLDGRGNVLTSFTVHLAPAGPPAPAAPRAIQRWDVPLGGGAARVAPPAAEMPRVMMGITMSEVPEALLDHLEIAQDSAVMVDSVLDGLPAQQAGLRPRDIIIEVDGKRPVTPLSIRETVGRKEAGQEVSLKILRRGQEHTLKVKLVPFEPGRFEMGEGGAAPGPADDAERRLRDAERMMIEQLERFRQDGQWDADAIRRFQGLQPDAADRMREMLRQRQLERIGPNVDFFVPLAPGGQQATREKLQTLDERMSDLERQMERLADRLEQMMRNLERREQDLRDELRRRP